MCSNGDALNHHLEASVTGSNHYRFSFVATCPADGEPITYCGEISSPVMIRVEHINAVTASVREGFHEDIADLLLRELGGTQVITAVHQGVTITTRRWLHEATPHGLTPAAFAVGDVQRQPGSKCTAAQVGAAAPEGPASCQRCGATSQG